MFPINGLELVVLGKKYDNSSTGAFRFFFFEIRVVVTLLKHKGGKL